MSGYIINALNLHFYSPSYYFVSVYFKLENIILSKAEKKTALLNI